MTEARATVKAIAALQQSNAHTATVFLSDRRTVTATRLRYRGRPDRHTFEARLTIGRPNYRGRQFIRLAQRAGERFPIRRVQLSGVR